MNFAFNSDQDLLRDTAARLLRDKVDLEQLTSQGNKPDTTYDKSLWQAIVAVQNYVIAHHGQVQEIEINPLICTHTRAIAVDALIVQGDAP